MPRQTGPRITSPAPTAAEETEPPREAGLPETILSAAFAAGGFKNESTALLRLHTAREGGFARVRRRGGR